MNSVIQKIKDIISKISADKKTLIIVAAGIIGVVILVMSEFLPGDEKTEKRRKLQLPENTASIIITNMLKCSKKSLQI